MRDGDQATPPERVLHNRSRRATFLCYHSVAPRGPRYLTISEELFERQLATLRRSRINCGGLDSLNEVAAGQRRQPTAFLTFDDGFLDNYSTVFPLLRSYGARAFVFVLPPLVDTGGAFEWPELADDLRLHPESMRSVTWEMLQEMSDGVFEVGSHTLTHRHLVDLDGESLREELLESRQRIIDRLGRCDVLAYPFGECNSKIEAAAADCGYRYAFSLPTSTGQTGGRSLAIPRVNVDYRDSGLRFALKLSPIGRRVFLSPAVRKGLRRRGSAEVEAPQPPAPPRSPPSP